MILATRTRKARRNGSCPLCPDPVWRGQSIALVGRTWLHTSCVLQWQKDRGPPEPEPPAADKPPDRRDNP